MLKEVKIITLSDSDLKYLRYLNRIGPSSIVKRAANEIKNYIYNNKNIIPKTISTFTSDGSISLYYENRNFLFRKKRLYIILHDDLTLVLMRINKDDFNERKSHVFNLKNYVSNKDESLLKIHLLPFIRDF